MVDLDVQEFLDKVKESCDDGVLGSIDAKITSEVQSAWGRWLSSSSGLTNAEEECAEIIKKKLDYIYNNLKCKDPCSPCVYKEKVSQTGTWSHGYTKWYHLGMGSGSAMLTMNVSVTCCSKDTTQNHDRFDFDELNNRTFEWYQVV